MHTERVYRIFKNNGCPDVEVEPTLGFYIPNPNDENAIIKGAEPSVLVTAKDIDKDLLDRFLYASGLLGKSYTQEAEILKFDIDEIQFRKILLKKLHGNLDAIGEIFDDIFMLSIEVGADLRKLFENSPNIIIHENYLQNLLIYTRILMKLEKTNYATTTWRIKRQTLGSIYIPGWSEEKLGFLAWARNFREICKGINKGIDTNILQGSGRGGKESPGLGFNTGGFFKRSEVYTGEEFVKLILIPQHDKDILRGDKLLYGHLVNPISRAKIRDRLIDLL